MKKLSTIFLLAIIVKCWFLLPYTLLIRGTTFPDCKGIPLTCRTVSIDEKTKLALCLLKGTEEEIEKLKSYKDCIFVANETFDIKDISAVTNTAKTLGVTSLVPSLYRY